MVGWFSPGTPVSSTTKVGRHDITKILLKVALRHQKSIKIIEDILTPEENHPTMSKQLVNSITCVCESSAPFL
jgi:hypothetical protein